MAFNTPVALYQSAAAVAAGFDPTLGGTITPNYWWDCQDSSQLSLTGTDVNSMTSKGSETDGAMTTTTNGTKPQFTTDSDGNNAILFTRAQQQRLGTGLTLIPWGQNITVFLAIKPVLSGISNDCPFGHEGYTYNGNFGNIRTQDRTKSAGNTQVMLDNGTLYDYGTAGNIPANSCFNDSRPVVQDTTGKYWVMAGTGGLTNAEMFNVGHTMISSRSWSSNNCTVKNAFDSNSMINSYTTEWLDSGNPTDGTAIGQAGRTNLNRSPYNGYVYQVVVYFTVLTSTQITDLRTSWLDNFTS